MTRPPARAAAALEQDIDAWADFLADPEATRLLHTPEPVDDPSGRSQAYNAGPRNSRSRSGCTASRSERVVRRPGFVGFVQRELDWGPELELGWLLRRAYWGRGFATEAARALRPLAPGRVVSMIRVENDASANVARKLGMNIERELGARYPPRNWSPEA